MLNATSFSSPRGFVERAGEMRANHLAASCAATLQMEGDRGFPPPRWPRGGARQRLLGRANCSRERAPLGMIFCGGLHRGCCRSLCWRE